MTTITIERAILDRLIDAWDSTVLPKSRDGMMQERMEDLRAALAAPATAPDEQLRKDAERYRWLRKTTNWVSSNGQRINVRDFPKSWDEHIDDAIKDKP